VIDVDALGKIAEARMKEGRQLLEAGHFAGAMFLGGCSLECYLKVGICVTLKLEGLPEAFKTHDLEALLLYSGFRAEMEANPLVEHAFIRIVESWKPDGRSAFLYADPAGTDKEMAEHFFKNLFDPEIGVVSWLISRISSKQA